MGDKIFQIFQKFLFPGSKYSSKIEINYPGGPNISIYLELKIGVQFSCDRISMLNKNSLGLLKRAQPSKVESRVLRHLRWLVAKNKS